MGRGDNEQSESIPETRLDHALAIQQAAGTWVPSTLAAASEGGASSNANAECSWQSTSRADTGHQPPSLEWECTVHGLRQWSQDPNGPSMNCEVGQAAASETAAGGIKDSELTAQMPDNLRYSERKLWEEGDDQHRELLARLSRTRAVADDSVSISASDAERKLLEYSEENDLGWGPGLAQEILFVLKD